MERGLHRATLGLPGHNLATHAAQRSTSEFDRQVVRLAPLPPAGRATLDLAAYHPETVMPAVLETRLADLPVRRGKVRDIYDLGDRSLIVTTDRISAFDWVMATGIPDKGRILTQLSAFWFERLKVPNHMLST